MRIILTINVFHCPQSWKQSLNPIGKCSSYLPLSGKSSCYCLVKLTICGDFLWGHKWSTRSKLANFSSGRGCVKDWTFHSKTWLHKIKLYFTQWNLSLLILNYTFKWQFLIFEEPSTGKRVEPFLVWPLQPTRSPWWLLLPK